MLFHVTMDVQLPPEMEPAKADALKKSERERAAELQRAGTWRHLWRIAGRYANISIFDVASPGDLHEILSTLPLFPYMSITVTALTRHPSSIHEDDR
jgi:muconolactone D-isomerase